MLKFLSSLKPEIVAAIIALVGIVISIGGSLIIANYTVKGQIEENRIEAIREMKRTYYNQLAMSYTQKLMYINKPESIEKIEAEMQFLEESSRLPLYASQKMVEFIERMKDPITAKQTSTTEFYKIMREDLTSNSFEGFKGLSDISISIPDKVIITDPEGNKLIQSK